MWGYSARIPKGKYCSFISEIRNSENETFRRRYISELWALVSTGIPRRFYTSVVACVCNTKHITNIYGKGLKFPVILWFYDVIFFQVWTLSHCFREKNLCKMHCSSQNNMHVGRETSLGEFLASISGYKCEK